METTIERFSANVRAQIEQILASCPVAGEGVNTWLPYFIAILACYLRAYKRHLTGRVAGPSLCLIPIDEAFSKMSGDGIGHSIDALKELDLQKRSYRLRRIHVQGRKVYHRRNKQ